MAFKRSDDGEFKFSIRGIDRIIEEKGNQFLALRQIAWGVGDDEPVDRDKIRLDLRKYRVDDNGKEIMSKGVSFMTDEGPSELVHVLLEEGYGNTKKCKNILNNRIESVDEEDDNLIDLRDVI